MEKTKLVIDTDIGTDPDDAFALTYAMKSLNADIKAITTVHGDTNIRAKIAKKLTDILGKNISITAGESCSKEMIKKYWAGIESLVLTKEELQDPFQNNEFPEYDKNTKLVCMGPLTNIAFQLQNNPTIKNVQEIYIMGHGDSHNIQLDFKASEKVLQQPWTIYQITKPVSLKIFFALDEIKALKRNKLGDFLYSSVKNWADLTGRKTFPMYDVLTVSAALEEGLVKFRQQDGKFVSYDVDPKLKEKIMKATEMQFENPCATADIIFEKNKKIVLIKRKHDPYKGRWALPGGFIDYGKENLEHCAVREGGEETGLIVNEKDLEFLIVTSSPGRDPRGHIISHTFIAKKYSGILKAGDDAAEAKEWPLDNYPKPLAFDHDYVISKYIEWREKNVQ